MENNAKTNFNIIEFFKDWILPIIVAIILAQFIKKFIFQPTKVEGLSMYPTLDEGDRLISTSIPYYFNKPKQGDIIIFKSPYNDQEAYIKRVIGVEGDNIRIEDGSFYINGKKLEEPYLDKSVNTYPSYNGINTWKVGDKEFFAVGDNRDNSSDSRDFGPVSKDEIIGKANFRFWPIDKIGVVKN